MRITAAVLLRIALFVLIAPSFAFAQQEQTVVNRVLGNVPDLVTSVVDGELPSGTISVQVIADQ